MFTLAIALLILSSDPGSFLERSVEMSQAQIQLADLAMNKSQDDRVKRFAETMVRSHKQALQAIEGVSQSGTTTDLTPEHQRALDRLSRLSGFQFDRQFIEVMLNEHRRAVRMFEQEAGIPGTRDRLRHTAPPTAGDMAEMALALLPVVRQQLSQTEDIRRELLSDR